MGTSTGRNVSGKGKYPETLEELAKQYWRHAVQERGVLEETAQAEQLYLRRFFDWFGPPDSPIRLFAAITPDSTAECLTCYASGHGPGSRNNMQKAVRLFLRFAHFHAYLKADWSILCPVPRVRRMGKVARAIPPGCIERMVSHIDGDSMADLRDRALFALLSTYGVRGVQVRQLRLYDIDWEHNRIHFPAAKGGRPIEQHLTAHVGNDIAVVKDWLGHADIKTTSLYLEISIERKRKALEKVPPPLGAIPPETPRWKQTELLTFLNRCSQQARYGA